MGRRAAARRLASAAAYGGGGLSLLGAGLYGMLRAEAKFARHLIGPADLAVPDATGWYGRGLPGPALRIALLGDSSAAGYGVESVRETPGAVLASMVAHAAGRRVYLRSYAVVGARSEDLEEQTEQALRMEPDVAVILVGANDVTHTVLPSTSVRFLGESVRRFVGSDVAVVMGTCPDLGTIRPIPPPLRQVARGWSRRLAAAQTIAVVEAGGRSVSLASILGEEFDAAPALFFGPDRFHPSATGYAALARVLVPSTLAALGMAPDDGRALVDRRGADVVPISDAAVRASDLPGVEVDGAEVSGRRRGVRGRWATLMRWRRPVAEETEEPQDVEESDEPASAGADPTDAAAEEIALGPVPPRLLRP